MTTPSLDHDRPLNILVIAETIPLRADQGSSIRNQHLIRGLAKRHNVTVVGYDPKESVSVPGTTLDGAVIESVRFAPERSLTAKIRTLVSSSSHQGSFFDTPALRAAIDDVVSRQRFDVVQIERSQLWSLRPRNGTPIVLDEHNIEYALRRQIIARQRSIPKRAFNTFDAAKFRRLERRAWQEVAGCTVTSAVDAAVVSRLAPRTPVGVIPNGVDIDYFGPTSDTVEADEILFVGMMDFTPNVDGATFFAREVMPLIRQRRPQARFSVVGKNASLGLIAELGGAANLVGEVADVRPWLARAAVVVVPLRMGSGTRLKVLEALASGKAVVSTAVGSEGIQVVAGQHIEIADEPRAFANAVSRLLADTAEARRLGNEGRALVERLYSWDVVVSALEAFHRRVLGARTARPA